MQDVAIIVTGGTLDKIHLVREESIGFPAEGRTHLPAILAEGWCDHPRVETMLMIDSLDMTDDHRAALARRIGVMAEGAIVITHGTSTMGDTARYLAERDLGRTIVLCGAMRPWSLSRSDAGFNLGGAVVAAQTLPDGVYGVMNGRVFDARKLHKNPETMRFDR